MVYLMNDPAANEMKSSQFGVFKWPCGDDVGIVSRRRCWRSMYLIRQEEVGSRGL